MTSTTHQLYAALIRVQPYLDLVPATAAAQVREAITAYEMECARSAIVQRPRVHQNCASCECVEREG